jgi:hypothetical protein
MRKDNQIMNTVPPRRSDHLRYRISGTGDVKINLVVRIGESGSGVDP